MISDEIFDLALCRNAQVVSADEVRWELKFRRVRGGGRLAGMAIDSVGSSQPRRRAVDSCRHTELANAVVARDSQNSQS